MTSWGDEEAFGFSCPHCKKTAIANVVGIIPTKTERLRDSGGGWGSDATHVAERAVLVQCGVCRKPVLVDQVFNWGYETRAVLWPAPMRAISAAVPVAIRETCEEAQGCFQHAYYKASVVMVRRALEGVCADQGSDKTTLAASLADLESRGKLDKRLVEWAHELRALGNLGAHFTSEQVTREDASDALAFVEALLDYLYVLSAQFDAFKQRRSSAAQTAKANKASGKATKAPATAV